MKFKFTRRLLTFLLTIIFTSSSFVAINANTVPTPDLTVQQMLQQPDLLITKGEFARLLNTYLKLDNINGESFKDVPAGYPYAEDLACAKAAGYFVGDKDGNVNPDAIMSGAEASVCVNYFLGFDLLKVGKDSSLNVPDWAAPASSNLLDLTMITKELAEKKQLTIDDANRFISALSIALLFQGSPYALKQASMNNDFFAYVNRQYLATATINPGYIYSMSFSDTQKIVNQQMSKLLNDITSSDSLKPGSDEWKINEIYKMYMDNKARTDSLEKLTPIFNDIKSAKSISDLDAAAAKYSIAFYFNPFISIAVQSDAKVDARNWAVFFVSGRLGLGSKDYYADNENLAGVQKAYKSLIANELSYIGETENLESRAEAYYKLEKSVSEKTISTDKLINPDVLYTSVKWSDLDKVTAHCNALNGNPNLKDTMKKLNVYCPDISYLQFIDSLYTENNLPVLKDIAMLSVLDTASSFLGDNYIDLSDDLMTAMLGAIGDKASLEQRAQSITVSLMSNVFSDMYASKYVTRETKDDVAQMIETIRQKRIEGINALDWMSSDTKVKAIEKLKAIKAYVAYPDNPVEKFKYDVTAKSDGGSLIDLYMSASQASNEKLIAKLQGSNDLNMWDSCPTYTVNAFYNPNENAIVVPAGILQTPFYSPNSGQEENLGAIGGVIAHEFTHAFDSNGAKYDKNGTLSNWWTDDDYAAFSSRTAKLADTLSQIVFIDDMKVNGALCTDETVADLGAISCVLDIAKDRNMDQGLVMKSWAKVWAARMSKETAAYFLSIDTNAPNKLRTNFVLSQQNEFYEVFNIGPEDDMYIAPENRINIW